MRVDKFLKNSRLIKRRTIAKEACEQGRVKINDKIAKPGTEVSVGDILTLEFGTRVIKVEVLDLKEHATKDDAKEMYKAIE
ncbi:Ribosomal 50S subunit-recycling heat shock protein, contains S4 domain [Caminicella sporogenes DSM 14501]|uniref:RQC P-site tRNA stabilizing factor n=1 Tax=Caminicella sporogenes DSM 14501 TaxID=1121266 RepID=A0A1M6QT15_9FIRM|nr:RNA-binding S4 domain-containing protein [Caminicella sporogenes]RKD20922.1 RNA-binding protein [Caminicella sporogenes]SHK23346.1 Ribosomal 50S subunit-recycling heat shock protein, contains S4 domain [Caminicella sporogenes DSM 14501]